MAKKTLGAQVLKKKSTLLSVAGVSQNFQSNVKDIADKNVKDLPEGIQEKIMFMKDADLIDDPLNKEYYGDLEVERLVDAMKEYGFQGVILAYPVEDGKYMIESGHRRRLAGRRAGITEFPVFITKKPEHEWERSLRLIGANLHNRPELTPMNMAKLAQALFEVHSEEIKYKKKNGLLQEGESVLVNEIVGNDLEMTSKNVEKYRRLLNLISGLQEIVESKKVPWSYLAEASNLPTEKQEELKAMIDEREIGASFEWVKKEIKKMKEEKKTAPTETPKPKTGEKKSGANKQFVKNLSKLNVMLDEEINPEDENIEEIVDSLEKLQQKIQEKITMLLS